MAIDKVSMSDDQMDQVTGGTKLPVTVMAGDTLASIAARYQRYDIKPEDIANWNGLDVNAPLTVGQTLKIYF